MSYVQGTDFLSLTAEVRELARSVVTADFSDDEIKHYQYMRYSQIRTLTDKDDWDTLDREYGTLQLVETKLAASDIIEHYGDVNSIPIWQAMRAAALADLTATVENLETPTGEASSSILTTEYKSWILNSAVAPPNRLSPTVTGGVETMGSREVDL
jgi:hypothetical protein